MRNPAPTCCQPGPNAEGFTGWEMVEAEAMAKKYKECEGNISQMVRHLGLTHPTIRKRLKKYGILKSTDDETTQEPPNSGSLPGQGQPVADTPDAVG